MSNKIPVIILGGSGYVAGELLRLLSYHKYFFPKLIISSSQNGKFLSEKFPYLKKTYPKEKFISIEAGIEGLQGHDHWMVISAANHGSSAKTINKIISESKKLNLKTNIIDIAADFRFDNKNDFEKTYGQDHTAPELIKSFICGIPEQIKENNYNNISHPGCFSTSMLLSIVPLVENNISEFDFFTSAVTGSTGSGSLPKINTHHPVRDGNFFSYKPLKHRHSIEVEHIIKKITNKGINLNFVPHSGPFTRGIYATTFCKLKNDYDEKYIFNLFKNYYKEKPFVDILNAPPKIKDVVGTNEAQLSISLNNNNLVICCVIDNLVKGAAGGAIQFANKLLGWPETEGLMIPPIGWA